MNNLSKREIEKEKDNYTKAKYPGSNVAPEDVILLLTSQNPSVSLSSKVLVEKGYDECEHVNLDSYEVSCPSIPGIQWRVIEYTKEGIRKILCLSEPEFDGNEKTSGGSRFFEEACNFDANFHRDCTTTYDQTNGNTCMGYGSNRLRFSLDETSLQENLFDYLCPGWY